MCEGSSQSGCDTREFMDLAQTGLPSGKPFMRTPHMGAVLERAITTRSESVDAQGQGLPILVLRVDRMATMLEAYGQPTWDKTVQFIGHLIHTCLAPRDSAALYARDRFLIMLSTVPRSDPDAVMARIRQSIAQAAAGGALPIPVTVSLVLAVGHGERPQDLVAQAEAALPQEPGASFTTSGIQTLSPPVITPITERPVILIVDDDEMVAHVIEASLAETDAVTLVAGSVDAALVRLHQEKIDVVVTDIHMPGRSGFDMLQQIQAVDASIVVIVITGYRDVDLAVKVIRSGADDFLIKPFSPDDLRISVANGLRKRQMILNGKAYQALLKSQVQQHAQDLKRTLLHLESTYRDTLKALGAALDTRDIETHAHSERVAQYALTLGRVIKMSEPELTTLERGVYLHDIGKIGIPDRVLLKDGSLRDEEWDVMKRHPQLGYRLASRVDFLKDAAKIILAHHERFDGSGYPYGLRGETIPLGARVFGVVDALDAITSDRPYRKARPFGIAREEIAAYRGSQFDPDIVDAFMSVPEQTWAEIRENVAREVAACEVPSEDQLIHDARRSFRS